MEKIKEIINEFISIDNNLILPFTIVIALVFLLIIFNYTWTYKTRLMTKILQSHGFVNENEEDFNSPHFHNVDSLSGSYDISRDIPIIPTEWDKKHFLFIPTSKINTLEKKGRKLTLYYNGYSSSGIVFKVKKINKGWKKRVVSKEKITNYNGTFIMSNMLVKTINLTSLDINLKDKKEAELKYLFDNGSIRTLRISKEDFFTDILYKDIPYNIAFLKQCEVIELY